MTRAPTYYELFDVSNNATAEQVRGAYLRLMKQYHPDVAGAPAKAGDFLPRINQAYEALSDPVRRAAYDAEIARPARTAMQPPVRSAFRAEPVPGARSAGRSWLVWAGAALAAGAMVVMLIPAANVRPEPDDGLSSVLSGLFLQAPAIENSPAPRFPSASDIRREARRGARLPADAAAARSEECFAAARQQVSREAAQLCVIFDVAFVYSHKTPSAPLPPYFGAVMIRLRHSSALDVDPADALLDRLWQASFAALMADMQQPSGAPDPAGPQSGMAGGGSQGR